MTRVVIRKHEGMLSAREASASAYAMLEKHLGDKYTLDMSELRIGRNPHGKPYFENCSVKFNISHSGKYAAIVLSELEVGIDIQTVKNISQRVALRYLESDETDPDLLTKLWTEFESVGKCAGCGIPHKLDKSEYYRFFEKLDSAWLCVSMSAKDEIELDFEP